MEGCVSGGLSDLPGCNEKWEIMYSTCKLDLLLSCW